jgi:hypothetical protein
MDIPALVRMQLPEDTEPAENVVRVTRLSTSASIIQQLADTVLNKNQIAAHILNQFRREIEYKDNNDWPAISSSYTEVFPCQNEGVLHRVTRVYI